MVSWLLTGAPEQRYWQNRETANVGLDSSVGRAPARQSGGRRFKSRSSQFSLFIQIYLKSVPSQFPLWFITWQVPVLLETTPMALVSRWRNVKRKESLVNYWLKHDGMIVRIPSSLVLVLVLVVVLTSKFYFAKNWIRAYIYFEKRWWILPPLIEHITNWIFFLELRARFSWSYAVLFWSIIWRQKQVSG